MCLIMITGPVAYATSGAHRAEQTTSSCATPDIRLLLSRALLVHSGRCAVTRWEKPDPHLADMEDE